MLRCPELKGPHAIWAMERGIPQKSDEEQGLLLRHLGLIIVAGIPTFSGNASQDRRLANER